MEQRADGRTRCWWAGDDALFIAYHDEEWGVASRDPAHLFEMLTLEGAQAGLSWATILRKRAGYRAAFDGFQTGVVAGYGPDDVERLMADAGIVRNRAKIEATIANARALRPLGVEFIEQPLPADDWTGMQRVFAESVLPIIADESCIVESDVARCEG